MFKFLLYKLIIFFTFMSIAKHAISENYELKLTEDTINSFYHYISSDRKPLDRFLVTTDGSGTFVWICPQILCFPSGETFYSKPCTKLNNKKPCKVFAVGRKVKARNQSNLKSSKLKEIQKFEQKNTLEEVRHDLKKLGFIN